MYGLSGLDLCPSRLCVGWQDELVVAGVFVRIYNEQPAFALDDPEAFAKGLVSWIHASAGVTLGPQAQIQARTDAGQSSLNQSCLRKLLPRTGDDCMGHGT